MKVVVCGSRGITDREAIRRAIEDADLAFGPITEIVHGGADGVDEIAGEIASDIGYEVRVFDAMWEEYGEAAGPIRNGEMAQYADAVVAVWDGSSKGTKNMIDQALVHGLDLIVKVISDDPEWEL